MQVHINFTCKILKTGGQFSTRLTHLRSLRFLCKWMGNCSAARILNDLLKNMTLVIILFHMTRVI